MKKIMIAAAVAAMGVAAFADCAPNPEVWVYNWKFTGKTTTGKPATAAAVNPCQPTGNTQASGCEKAYRVPASLKIQGYTYACPAKYCSDGDKAGDSLGFETAFTEPNEVFYMTKPYKASFWGGVTTEIAHIIGKNKKQAEIQGIASLTENVENSTFTLVYAGFGKINASKRVTSVSGNFAGTLSQPWIVGTSGTGSKKQYYCFPAGYWSCESISTLLCGPSIAYGKWSAKYNSTGSKKFKKDGTTVKMPNWVEWLNK